jgi:hypothetical protein
MTWQAHARSAAFPSSGRPANRRDFVDQGFLESFAAAAHDILTATPGPQGREKVRALLQDVLLDRAFVAKHLGDDVPERKVLYEDPALGFCILAHVHHGARARR